MAQWWSHEANGRTIFYKLREHLATHYKTWKEHQQGVQSSVATEKQCLPNTNRIRSKNHSAVVLPAASRQHPGVRVAAETAATFSTSNEGDMEVDEYTPDVVQMEDVQVTVPVSQETVSFQFQDPLTAASSSLISPQNISWSGSRKSKKCALCKQKGCPGSGNRKLCTTSISADANDLIV